MTEIGQGTRRIFRTAVLAALAVGLLCSTSAPPVHANADETGWPRINGKRRLDTGPPGRHHVFRGYNNRHNELLGGYGNDTLYGGNIGDVLWADYHPGNQPSGQVTYIYAGNGKNFIYASHARNIIYTGTGPTVVHADFGRGVIHCGSAAVTVITSHRDRPFWQLPGCRHVQL